MDRKDEDALALCLLQWVQSFQNAARTEKLEELADGRLLWTILQTIDAEYFNGQLPEPEVNNSSDWTRKWQNLKHVEKQVSTYYRDFCNGQEQINVQALPDVKAIAADVSIANMEKLIMTIIHAAMASPESNQKMAQRLMGLGRDNAMMIAKELRSMEDEDYTESEPISQDESAYHSEQEETPVKMRANGTTERNKAYKDPLLEREEELLKAQATIDRMETSHIQAQHQLQDLRLEKERLQEAFDAYRNEIESKGRKVVGDESFKKLQRQADNDRAYIDDLETQLQSSKGTIDNYERQFQRFKDDNESTQKLRDEVQLLKVDNEDLNQKIKANENLKKKIQTLQEQEKTNASLRDEIKQANERLEALDRLKQVQAALEKEIIEKQGLIRNQEYQINELTTTRKHAEYDARVFAQKLQEARERHDRDHEIIQNLKGKMDDSDLVDATGVEEVDAEDKGVAKIDANAKTASSANDESKHLTEKIALLQQQLESADARLKQASERNATLEEQQLGSSASAQENEKASRRLQEHEHTIANLRRDLDQALRQKSEGQALPQDLVSLQRENHLMATAWFDLSSRLQNNGVSLGRRRQDPKSWIAKQRLLVASNTIVSISQAIVHAMS